VIITASSRCAPPHDGSARDAPRRSREALPASRGALQRCSCRARAAARARVEAIGDRFRPTARCLDASPGGVVIRRVGPFTRTRRGGLGEAPLQSIDAGFAIESRLTDFSTVVRAGSSSPALQLLANIVPAPAIA